MASQTVTLCLMEWKLNDVISVTVSDVIALGAALLAIAAIVTTVVLHPRARLVFSWEGAAVQMNDDDFLSTKLVITNEGSVAAKGLRLNASTVVIESGYPWLTKNVLDAGESWEMQVPRVPVSRISFGPDDVMLVAKNSSQRDAQHVVVTVRHANRRCRWRSNSPKVKETWWQPEFRREDFEGEL